MAVTRPGLGPTLPGALRERFGIPPLVTLLAAGAIAVAAVATILIVLDGRRAPGEQVVRERPPVFNLLYAPAALREAEPLDGQLLRLEGARDGLRAQVTVEPLELPPFEGDVTHGLLPVYANRFVDAAQRRMPGLELTQEGRARVNNAVGYEVGYERRSAGERFTGREVLLVPDDPEEGRGAVLLGLELRAPGDRKLEARERNLAFLARKAYRSFRFGTERG